MKICRICGKEYKRTGTRCDSCINKNRKAQQNEYRRNKYKIDFKYRERVINTVKKSTEKRIDKILKYREEYYNRPEIIEKIKKYNKLPKTIKRHNNYKVKHYADKIKACPKWLSKKQKQELLEIYKNCPEDYEVDHIIPLKGKNIRGLHVPWNLQYLKRELNNFKNNKFDGTYENNSWKEEYLNEL